MDADSRSRPEYRPSSSSQGVLSAYDLVIGLHPFRVDVTVAGQRRIFTGLPQVKAVLFRQEPDVEQEYAQASGLSTAGSLAMVFEGLLTRCSVLAFGCAQVCSVVVQTLFQRPTFRVLPHHQRGDAGHD